MSTHEANQITGDFTLEARDIRKSFNGVEVLHGVDLNVVGGRTVALLGENGAGKSTLVRILAGDYRADGGILKLGGTEHRSFDPLQARAAGIRMIFQEFTDAPTLTVAENISLGRWPRGRGGLVDWRMLRSRAVAILDGLGVDLDPEALVGTLRVGERQICEIARALADDARCLVLDEPTAALSATESEQLFEYVRRLRRQGVAIVYITHRLDEVAKIADEVVVLRNGQVALASPASALSRQEMVSAMVGTTMAEVQRPERTSAADLGPVRCALKGASSTRAFTDLNVEIRAGEVLALYGKIGSGIAEVADTIFGLRPLSTGSLTIDGADVHFSNPRAAVDAGVAYLPSDRQREGTFMVRPVSENLAAPSWPRMARFGWLKAKTESSAFRRWQKPLRIATSGNPRQPIATLSGGNQQKVLVARWLERASGVLAFVEPTRGVDVGARRDIYMVIRDMAAHGAAVLIATSDYEEVVQVADRAVVMVSGRVSAELSYDEISTQRLTDAAGG